MAEGVPPEDPLPVAPRDDKAVTAPQDLPMDIHKPKPVHNLREFASEIFVIVIGVLIALSGEQIVEWLHWREAVAETRESLGRELAFNLGVIQSRIDAAPCIARRSAELRTMFARHAAGQPVVLAGRFSQPNFPHLRTSVWETAMADQSLSHMPRDLRLRYAGLYEGIYWLRDKEAAESEAWTTFAQLDAPQLLGESDWASLHRDAARAQSLAEKVDATLVPGDGSAVGYRFFSMGEALGVKVERYRYTPSMKAIVDAFCRPVL